MPSQFTIRVEKDVVQVGLTRLAASIPEAYKDVMEGAMEEAKIEASGGYSGGNSYTVPTVYGQTYIRTGNLGRAVFWERDGQSYRMKHNAASLRGGGEYGTKVLGRADGSGQTKWFVGRWPNFKTVMDKWGRIIIERLNNAVEKAIRQAGFFKEA